MRNVIKNFNMITTTGIAFIPGNEIIVQDGNSFTGTGKTIVAVAKFENQIDDEFAVADAMQFYSCLCTFDSPQVNAQGRNIIISDSLDPGSGKFSLTAASSMVVKRPTETNFPEDRLSQPFLLTESQMARLNKAIGVISSTSQVVKLKGDGGNVVCSAYDANNPSTNSYTVDITKSDSIFEVVLGVEALQKVMKNVAYQVSVLDQIAVKFTSGGPLPLTYYIAAQK
jgi:hypothetical protein